MFAARSATTPSRRRSPPRNCRQRDSRCVYPSRPHAPGGTPRKQASDPRAHATRAQNAQIRAICSMTGIRPSATQIGGLACALPRGGHAASSTLHEPCIRSGRDRSHNLPSPLGGRTARRAAPAPASGDAAKPSFSAPTPWRSWAPSPRVVPGATTGEPGRVNPGPLPVSLLDGKRPARFGAVVCAPLVRAAVPHSREAALVQVGDTDSDDLAELAAVIAWASDVQASVILSAVE